MRTAHLRENATGRGEQLYENCTLQEECFRGREISLMAHCKINASGRGGGVIGFMRIGHFRKKGNQFYDHWTRQEKCFRGRGIILG